jgi:hypothetical protein
MIVWHKGLLLLSESQRALVTAANHRDLLPLSLSDARAIPPPYPACSLPDPTDSASPGTRTDAKRAHTAEGRFPAEACARETPAPCLASSCGPLAQCNHGGGGGGGGGGERGAMIMQERRRRR